MAVCGSAGGLIASLYGGWPQAMTTLMIMMAADFISGLVCAGIFKKSDKSDSGMLSSRAGWKGLCRKGMVMLVVLVAAQLDILTQTFFIRDSVIIAFIVNEALSILENAALMGLPIPKQLLNALDVMRQKGGKKP